MNCQNFENIVADLAREHTLDADTRSDAHAHAHDCAPCAARLAAERALTTCLRRAFAPEAGDGRQEASPRVESALLAAFRQHHAAPRAANESRVAAPCAATPVVSESPVVAATPVTSPVVSPVVSSIAASASAAIAAKASSENAQSSSHAAEASRATGDADAHASIAPMSIQAHVEAKKRRAARAGSQESFWKFAAVAAALAVVALLTLFAARTSLRRDELRGGAEQARRAETREAAPSSSSRDEMGEAVAGQASAAQASGGRSIIDGEVAGVIKQNAEDEPEAVRGAETDASPQPWQRAAATPRTNARAGAGYSNAGLNVAANGHNARAARNSTRAGRASAATTANASATEIATDFFPLAGAMTLRQTDSGHIVRVELPRSALASFGLPVNTERLGERVKADVYFGDDGIARAIRFVR